MPSGPRRVAFVASYAPSLTLFRGPLIRDIVARGHAMLCAAPDIDDEIAARLREWGAEVREIPLSRTGLNPVRDLRTILALTRLFREWRADVVMGYTPKPAIYGTIAANRAGVPRIVPMITGLGYAYLEGGGLTRRIVRGVMSALYRHALSLSHGVVFHNKDDARIFAELRIVPPGLPVAVSRGSGVDIAHYARQPLPPLDGEIRFLMIARLVRYKGVAEYCEAARMLRRQGAKARCLLAGPPETGPAGFPLELLEGYADAVTWLGPSDDVRPLLRDAHVYVLPSYGEGMPRTVLEALATGRPIITTRARGCRETVSQGVNGYLVPVRDAAALARAMSKMIERRNDLPAMAAESRKIAEKEFDVKQINELMLNVLALD